MKKSAIIIILVFLTLGFTQAQENSSIGYKPTSYYTFSWNMTFPMSDFHDWVGEAGLAGFDIGGRYFVKNGLAITGLPGWFRFRQWSPTILFLRR